eukprot:m.146550 g.146550  ORF g.146550 m.146550 type:complete len:65 (+) comp15034_c0_seq37:2359-2553(+)
MVTMESDSAVLWSSWTGTDETKPPEYTSVSPVLWAIESEHTIFEFSFILTNKLTLTILTHLLTR